MTFTATALTVVVFCSLGWSALDFLRKVLVAKIPPLALLFYLTAGMLPFFAVWVAVDGRTSFAPGYAWPALGSILLNLGANLAFIQAVRLSPLSLTIPFLSFTPVFAALLAIPLLGELPTPVQGLGILTVVVGAFTLHLGPGGASLRGVLGAFWRERGCPLAMLVSLLWAATVALDKLAIERSNEPLHGLVLIAGIGLASFLLLVARGEVRDLATARAAPATLAGALVVGSVSLALQLVAIKLVWVSIVETVKRGVGNTMAVIMGRLVFNEPVTAQKVVGVVLMAVGVAVVLFG